MANELAQSCSRIGIVLQYQTSHNSVEGVFEAKVARVAFDKCDVGISQGRRSFPSFLHCLRREVSACHVAIRSNHFPREKCLVTRPAARVQNLHPLDSAGLLGETCWLA